MAPDRDAPAMVPRADDDRDVASADGLDEALHALDDDGDEPDALGAAPTLPAPRRERGARGRARRSEPGVDAGVGAPPRPLEPLPPVDIAPGEQVSVFEPHSASRQRLVPYIHTLWERRPFIVEMARSNRRGHTAGSALGSLWTVLDPLFQAGLYYLLFAVIRQGRRPIEFLPILIAGFFLFTLTISAINEGGRSVRKSTKLTLNSAFPRAVLPVTAVYSSLLKFVPALIVYVPIYLVWGQPVQSGLLALPVLFVILVVLNLGVALLTSTVVVFYRDAENMLRYVQRLLFFTTPVIYPAALLSPEIREALAWHPLFPLFSNFQRVLAGGTVDTRYAAFSAGWAVFFLVVGAWVFLRNERSMASRL